MIWSTVDSQCWPVKDLLILKKDEVDLRLIHNVDLFNLNWSINDEIDLLNIHNDDLLKNNRSIKNNIDLLLIHLVKSV